MLYLYDNQGWTASKESIAERLDLPIEEATRAHDELYDLVLISQKLNVDNKYYSQINERGLKVLKRIEKAEDNKSRRMDVFITAIITITAALLGAIVGARQQAALSRLQETKTDKPIIQIVRDTVYLPAKQDTTLVRVVKRKK